MTRSFGVFFDLRLNKQLSKQSRGWWLETPSCPLWRHPNATFQCYFTADIYCTNTVTKVIQSRYIPWQSCYCAKLQHEWWKPCYYVFTADIHRHDQVFICSKTIPIQIQKVRTYSPTIWLRQAKQKLQFAFSLDEQEDPFTGLILQSSVGKLERRGNDGIISRGNGKDRLQSFQKSHSFKRVYSYSVVYTVLQRGGLLYTILDKHW